MPRVEVVYALAQRSIVLELQLPAGALLTEALQAAAADENFRQLELADAAVGVFGKVAPRDYVLQEGDRVEIYRPLLADAKLARRQRASGKASKSGRS